jgi:hypothetical protein
VEILSVPFCAWCAREQEAYFTVGEITQEIADDRTKRAHNSLDEWLVELLEQVRWGFDERLDEAEEYAGAVKGNGKHDMWSAHYKRLHTLQNELSANVCSCISYADNLAGKGRQ